MLIGGLTQEINPNLLLQELQSAVLISHNEKLQMIQSVESCDKQPHKQTNKQLQIPTYFPKLREGANPVKDIINAICKRLNVMSRSSRLSKDLQGGVQQLFAFRGKIGELEDYLSFYHYTCLSINTL